MTVLAVLLLAATATGRPVLAALAVPFALSIAIVAGSSRPRLRLAVPALSTQITEDDPLPVEVVLQSDTGLDLCAVRVAGGDFAAAPGTPAWRVVALDRAGRRTVSLTVEPKRWGRAVLGPVTVVQSSALLLRSDAGTAPPLPVGVHPRRLLMQPDVALPRSRAYSGSHRSRATGPGVEFERLRPFQPGDRRRSVNWRATARRNELTVNSTNTDLAADVVLVVDAVHDIPARTAGGATSLDLSVRAMSGLVEHYLRLGDRVGLLEWAGGQRVLPARTGRAQLTSARDWLLDVGGALTAAPRPLWWPGEFAALRPLTIVFSPLADEPSLALLATLRQRGLPVVAIDTLPEGAPARSDDLVEDMTRRLWLLRRDQRIARLGEIGAPVVAVDADRSLQRAIADLARLATAPRLAVR